MTSLKEIIIHLSFRALRGRVYSLLLFFHRAFLRGRSYRKGFLGTQESERLPNKESHFIFREEKDTVH